MNSFRKTASYQKRQEANEMANARHCPQHLSNGDELKFRHKGETAEVHEKAHEDRHQDHGHKFKPLKLKHKPSYLVSFTKGLPHNYTTGLVQDPDHYQYFVQAIDSGDKRDFRDTPLGFPENIGLFEHVEHSGVITDDEWKSEKARTGKDGKEPVHIRGWESQSAGLAFDLQGPDPQSVTMPPAPRLGSIELIAEIAEVYAQALLRDVPFKAFSAGTDVLDRNKFNTLAIKPKELDEIRKFTDKLNKLEWFTKTSCELCLDHPEKARHRGYKQTPSNAFRGITPGDDIGPYLSQFLLIGNEGINHANDPTPERKKEDGYINYGAISIDQRVRVATPEKDYMTCWDEWYDVQNGADVRGLDSYIEKPYRRFIYTPRDLATYVHFDALYEAYLNAALILLGKGIPFDPGIPFQEADNRDHQQGFAHFGGPHILSLVTEVATRALKAVRFQKFNIHRRCRPEVIAARITKGKELGKIPELATMLEALGDSGADILQHVDKHNDKMNDGGRRCNADRMPNNYLLPMAFCEGSPMHPSYGAGHATVAGACVTILKAFFDHKHPFAPNGKDTDKAYVSVDDGKSLELVPVYDQDCVPAHLTVEGELNKLASNISIGRNWAGVHYFTDYYESLLMGEKIAIGILEEQKLMFGENFSMSLCTFNGNSIRI